MNADAESGSFAEEVYSLVAAIPAGRILSYGAVAALLGRPRAARVVGQALRQLPAHRADVPWWRVVNREGRISLPDPQGGAQRAKLSAEGVVFGAGGAIDWHRYGWRP